MRFGPQAKTFGECHRWARGKVRTIILFPIFFSPIGSEYVAEGKQQGCSRLRVAGRQKQKDGCYPASERGACRAI